MALWIEDLDTALQIKLWDIKETQLLDEMKSQKVVSRICNIYFSRC